MIKFKRIIIISIILISGCHRQFVFDDFIPGNFILDADWKQDVYNLVYTTVDEVDNFQYWIRKSSNRTVNSPHQIACVEIKEAMKPSTFYIANLDFYSMKKVQDCDLSYVLYVGAENVSSEELLLSGIKNGNENLLNNSLVNKDNSEYHTIFYGENNNKLDLIKYHKSKHIRLIFSDLFPVNEYQITKNGRATLSEVIREVLLLPVEEMVIYGVADSSGNYYNNKKLARMRAESVQGFFNEHGLVNIPIFLRATVENSDRSSAEKRIYQRRFIIEVKLK